MSEWFAYDWQVRGEAARFVVDLSYAVPPEGFSTLVYCAVAPLQPDIPFTNGELAQLLRIERKLLRMLPDACYVGHIHMAALRQYYFYMQDAAELAAELDALSHKARKLSIHHGITQEPAWVTYHELLYPDAAKAQTERNAQLISIQKKQGDALEKVRRLTLIMCFYAEIDKLHFREAARNAGFAIGEEYMEDQHDRPYALTIYMLTNLEKQSIDAITTRAIRTAEVYNGELLRWTCPKVGKRSPLA